MRHNNSRDNKLNIIEQLRQVSKLSLEKKLDSSGGEMKAKDIVSYTNELMDATLNGTSNYIRKNLAHQVNILVQDQS